MLVPTSMWTTEKLRFDHTGTCYNPERQATLSTKLTEFYHFTLTFTILIRKGWTFFPLFSSSFLFDLFSLPSLKLYWKLPTGNPKYRVCIVLFRFYIFFKMGICSLLWNVVDRCGSFWVGPSFSNYEISIWCSLTVTKYKLYHDILQSFRIKVTYDSFSRSVAFILKITFEK